MIVNSSLFALRTVVALGVLLSACGLKPVNNPTLPPAESGEGGALGGPGAGGRAGVRAEIGGAGGGVGKGQGGSPGGGVDANRGVDVPVVRPPAAGVSGNGAACSAASDCASKFCVDRICCEVSCAGACVACNLPGLVGKCTSVGEGIADPHGLCRDQGAESCGRTGKCNGQGGCASYPAGISCGASVCDGTNWSPPSTCDGAGSCLRANPVNCYPYLCAGAAGCRLRCETDADCLNGKPCANGLCDVKKNGQPCQGTSECASGVCADGICCNEACTGACRSCALAASRGICKPVTAGTKDPRNKCAAESATTCGTDGTCEAGGICAKHPAGTVCKPETCASGTHREPSRCDGRGLCMAGASQSCEPYVCSGAKCAATCAGAPASCDEGYLCEGGSCGKKTDGAVCSLGSECGSGLCSQGVCCVEACTGACRACNQPNSLGTCTVVTAGANDPSGLCIDGLATTCGNDGKCDGKGACRKYAAGTMCKPSSCPVGAESFTAAATCDGKGSCLSGGSQSCAPSRCDGTACRSKCTGDADCIAPNKCANGVCGKKSLGAGCAGSDECSSGNCVDGACCDSSACGTCRSCNVSGQAGKCVAVASGQADPGNRCPTAVTLPCGNTGLCDGAGMCQLAGTNVQCAPARCEINQRTNPSTCDGSGICVAGATSGCGLFKCALDATCPKICEQNSDCVAGAKCKGKGANRNTCQN